MLNYCTLDVFTDTKFQGNPLAVVHVPSSLQLTKAQKHKLTIEFNYSETIFIHEPSKDSPLIYPIDIFTIQGELAFAGHPTIGAGWYLFKNHPDASTITLRVKAGDIPVERVGDGVRLTVPSDYKTHALLDITALKKSQVKLRPEDYAGGSNNQVPVASIVKGVGFILLEVTSLSALGKLSFSGQIGVPDDHVGDWKGFYGLYAFYRCEDGTIRTRMFEGSFEDPATGAAASTLAAWLSETSGDGKWSYDIVQGVEMGRRSLIAVSAQVEGGTVKNVELAGNAVKVMEGKLDI